MWLRWMDQTQADQGHWMNEQTAIDSGNVWLWLVYEATTWSSREGKHYHLVGSITWILSVLYNVDWVMYSCVAANASAAANNWANRRAGWLRTSETRRAVAATTSGFPGARPCDV
jgi:hypothetical protein